MQVRFSPAAIRDLERLRAFLRPRNPMAAKRAGQAIIDGVRALGAHPHMGRTIEALPEQFRDWLIPFGDSACVARYHFGDDRVTILLLRHQKEMDWSVKGEG